MLFVVLGSCRKDVVWSWWAVLAGSFVLASLIALRAPLLGTRLGLAAPRSYPAGPLAPARGGRRRADLEAGRYAPSRLLAFRIARVFAASVEEVFQYDF